MTDGKTNLSKPFDEFNKYTSEMNQYIHETHDYFNCFAFQKEVTESNRFGRYVTKTKKNLMDFLRKMIRVYDPSTTKDYCTQNSIMNLKYKDIDFSDEPEALMLIYGHSDRQGKLYPGSFEAIIFNLLKTCTYVETCIMLKNRSEEFSSKNDGIIFPDQEDSEAVDALFDILSQNTFSKNEIPFAQGLHNYKVSNYDFLWNSVLSTPDANGKKQIDVDKLFKPVDFYEQIDPDTSTYFKEIVNYELTEACSKFIAEQFLESRKQPGAQEINESNYFTTIPEQPSDCIKILVNVLNWVKIDIERKYQSNISEAFSAAYKKNIHKKMLKLKRQNLTLQEKTKKDLEAKDIVIKKKDNALQQMKKKITPQKSNRALEDYCHQLEHQNQKLLEKYNRLYQKYESLKDSISDTNPSLLEPAPAEFQPKEIDFNERYVFVMRDFAYTKTIQETFPNARIIDQNVTLDPNSVFLVIVVPGCIDHSSYYGIKGQCKDKDIPLIHSNNTNIEMIKNLIWTHINS